MGYFMLVLRVYVFVLGGHQTSTTGYRATTTTTTTASIAGWLDGGKNTISVLSGRGEKRRSRRGSSLLACLDFGLFFVCLVCPEGAQTGSCEVRAFFFVDSEESWRLVLLLGRLVR